MTESLGAATEIDQLHPLLRIPEEHLSGQPGSRGLPVGAGDSSDSPASRASRVPLPPKELAAGATWLGRTATGPVYGKCRCGVGGEGWRRGGAPGESGPAAGVEGRAGPPVQSQTCSLPLAMRLF